MVDGDPKILTFRREGEPYPADILPTARFFSTLPDFDHEYYGHWPIREYSSWKGATMIEGTHGRIEIAHIRDETTVIIVAGDRADQWNIDEKYLDCVTYRHNGIILEPAFIGGPDGKQIALRGSNLEPLPGFQIHFTDEFDEFHLPEVRKPSDAWLRRMSTVDMDKSIAWGADITIPEALDFLVKMRGWISNAATLHGGQPAPMPSSGGLGSSRYFPEA